MKKHKQTRKFVNTLINTAGIDGIPKAAAELSALHGLMRGNKEFHSLLIGPQFLDNEKHGVIKEVGERLGFSEGIIKFVSYLSDIKALDALPDIISIAVSIYHEKKKKAKATVFTPHGIGGEYEERLKSALKGLIERDVDIEYVVDPLLLGGMLVKVGSTMYDGSIKGQLRLLGEALKAG